MPVSLFQQLAMHTFRRLFCRPDPYCWVAYLGQVPSLFAISRFQRVPGLARRARAWSVMVMVMVMVMHGHGGVLVSMSVNVFQLPECCWFLNILGMGLAGVVPVSLFRP